MGKTLLNLPKMMMCTLIGSLMGVSCDKTHDHLKISIEPRSPPVNKPDPHEKTQKILTADAHLALAGWSDFAELMQIAVLKKNISSCVQYRSNLVRWNCPFLKNRPSSRLGEALLMNQNSSKITLKTSDDTPLRIAVEFKGHLYHGLQKLEIELEPLSETSFQVNYFSSYDYSYFVPKNKEYWQNSFNWDLQGELSIHQEDLQLKKGLGHFTIRRVWNSPRGPTQTKDIWQIQAESDINWVQCLIPVGKFVFLNQEQVSLTILSSDKEGVYGAGQIKLASPWPTCQENLYGLFVSAPAWYRKSRPLRAPQINVK